MNQLSRGRTSVEFETPYGFRILLPPKSKGLVIAALKGVLFHPRLSQFLIPLIHPGDRVVDGGSHVGFFTLLAARLLVGRGRVYAFEPDSETFSLLKQNVERNGLSCLVQLEQKALANANEGLEFSRARESVLGSLFSRGDGTEERVRVEAVRLDDYLAKVGENRIDVIKLDLEGAEPMALEAMDRSLKTARLLVFEVNEPYLEQMKVDPVALVNETARAGSFDQVIFIDERADKMCGWSPGNFLDVLHDYKFVNVICARRGEVPNP